MIEEVRPVAVSEDALAKVRAIRDEAIALGWTEAEILGTCGGLRFPCGDGWGLVCFVQPRDSIARVRADYIEFGDGAKRAMRFYRRGVQQPWNRVHESLEVGPKLWPQEMEDRVKRWAEARREAARSGRGGKKRRRKS